MRGSRNFAAYAARFSNPCEKKNGHHASYTTNKQPSNKLHAPVLRLVALRPCHHQNVFFTNLLAALRLSSTALTVRSHGCLKTELALMFDWDQAFLHLKNIFHSEEFALDGKQLTNAPQRLRCSFGHCVAPPFIPLFTKMSKLPPPRAPITISSTYLGNYLQDPWLNLDSSDSLMFIDSFKPDRRIRASKNKTRCGIAYINPFWSGNSVVIHLYFPDESTTWYLTVTPGFLVIAVRL